MKTSRQRPRPRPGRRADDPMTAYLAALAEAAESDRMRRWLAAAMEASKRLNEARPPVIAEPVDAKGSKEEAEWRSSGAITVWPLHQHDEC